MKKITTDLYIKSVYIPPGEFDYEGCIDAVFHGIDFGFRVLPVNGTWEFWTSGKTVMVSLFLSKQGAIKKCKPYTPTRFLRLARWTYRVEGMIAENNPNQGHIVTGFPEFELDHDIVQEGWDFIQESYGLSYVAELWAEEADEYK